MADIAVGLIGCGGIMRHRLGRLLAVPGVRIAAMADPSPEQIARTKEQHPAAAVAAEFAAHEDLIASGLCQAVTINSPHRDHAPQAIAAFQAGLHALIEKPLANSVAQAEAIIAARDASGKVGALAYQRHGEPIFQEARRIVQSGQFGRLTMVNSHLGQEWKRATKGSWRQDPELSGGGQIHDSGSHMIDMLLWITGLRAEAVTGFMDNRETPVDIDSALAIRFAGGAYGSLTIIGDAAGWHERHALWMERASLFIEGHRLVIREEGKDEVVMDSWPEGRSPDENFIAAIRGEEEVQAPLECGLETIRLTELAWTRTERR
jgi:predicted dehydrogenase